MGVNSEPCWEKRKVEFCFGLSLEGFITKAADVSNGHDFKGVYEVLLGRFSSSMFAIGLWIAFLSRQVFVPMNTALEANPGVINGGGTKRRYNGER